MAEVEKGSDITQELAAVNIHCRLANSVLMKN